MLCAFHGLTGDLFHRARWQDMDTAAAAELSSAEIMAAFGACVLVVLLAAWLWSWAGTGGRSPNGRQERAP